MNCAQFEWAVVDIAAGRNDAGAETRGHLARCERCRARLLAERRLTASLRDLSTALSALSAPARVEQALQARLQRLNPDVHALYAPTTRRRWFARRRWITRGAVAAAVMALLGVVLTNAVHDGAQLAPPPLAELRHPEIATPFYPVYMTAAVVAGARGLVRVRVPRATLAVFGLPYNPRRATDPITADLMVDNGGMVTALRFVQ